MVTSAAKERRYWTECTEKKQMSGFWSKAGTVRHRQSKEASIMWSHHEETGELPGERDNARNNARCTGEEHHARPGWTSRRGQDSPWKSQIRMIGDRDK